LKDLLTRIPVIVLEAYPTPPGNDEQSLYWSRTSWIICRQWRSYSLSD